MLMVCGAVISKTKSYPGFIKYQQPSLWRRLGQTRSKRDLRDNVSSKIGEHSFESIRYSRNNLLRLYSCMVKDEKTAIEVTAFLGLELEELIYLSGSTKPSKKLQKIYDEAQELLREGKDDEEEQGFFKIPVSSEDRKQVTFCSIIQRPEEPEKKNSDSSENSDFRLSEGKQRTFNFNLDVSSEMSGEKEISESNTPDSVVSNPLLSDMLASDSPKSLGNKVSYPSEPLEKQAFLGSETLDEKVSSEPLKQKMPANDEPADNKSDIIEAPEPKSSDFEVEASGTPKKAELKTQKTLFDF